jgi:serine/threonine protein kinase
MPSTKEKPPSTLCQGRYRIEKSLGAGCFGEVWRGHDNQTKEQVAVKFENLGAHSLQLEHEANVLRVLAKPTHPQGFAHCFYVGVEGKYQCMIMELLGRSLEDRVQTCKGNKFTVPTAVLVAEQLLCRIEYLHSKGIIHRDIKPENFMFGAKDKIHHLYLIDFGLSKWYWDNGKHTQIKTKGQLTGTARYASINAHRGVEQSRRDDLEAIGHMLMYFLRGALPWSGLEAKTQEEKYRKIREKKEQTPLDQLCAGFPDAFKTYLQTARELEFKQRPDYVALRELFLKVRKIHHTKLEDHDFQWFEGKDLTKEYGKLVPLAPWGDGPRQPDDQGPSRKGSGGGGGWFCCGGKNNVQD